MDNTINWILLVECHWFGLVRKTMPETLPLGGWHMNSLSPVFCCSVIKNWGQEIKKWLGMERAAYLVLLPGKEAASQVCHFILPSFKPPRPIGDNHTPQFTPLGM